jgi:hypothetical protein
MAGSVRALNYHAPANFRPKHVPGPIDHCNLAEGVSPAGFFEADLVTVKGAPATVRLPGLSARRRRKLEIMPLLRLSIPFSVEQNGFPA